MTKVEFANEIAMATGYSRKQVLDIIEAGMDVAMKNIINGENIYLRGFGTLTTKVRKQKVARIITKQQSIIVPEHKIPAFKAAKSFVQSLNK